MGDALEVLWDWSYEIEQSRLEELYVKAKREQWNADVALDWSRVVDPAGRILDPERMAFLRMDFFKGLSKSQMDGFNARYSAWVLSQLLHGEQGALMVAGQLVSAVPDYEAKLYVASQAMDEARHVEVFARYIRRLDRIYPVQPILRGILDRIMSSPFWQAKMVGMQVILEGLALGSFINVRAATACDLLRDALAYVIKDEARHVAFGSLYLGRGIAEMHPDDRAVVEDFALDATRLTLLMRRGMEGFEGFDAVLRESGIDPADFLKALYAEVAGGFQLASTPGSVHTFRGLVLPGIVRAGLVSDRVRPAYESARIEPFSDTALLDEIERTGALERPSA
ncbi:MAG: ferritin-like domain-containing protein [Deltaproteobacteria bacterium]|nr:ferritin-like domain-containing protein [Deltaproteobacteria bacterium]